MDEFKDINNSNTVPRPDTFFDSKNQVHHRRYLVVLSLLLGGVVVAGGYYIYAYFLHSFPFRIAEPKIQTSNTSQNIQNNVVVSHNIQGEVPAHLPPDLVQEKDVHVVDSYSALDKKTNMYQQTYRYDSKNDIHTNIALYKNYLTKNGWSVQTATSTVPTLLQVITARKDIYTLSVLTHYNTALNISSVEITILYPFPKLVPAIHKQ